MKNDHYLQKDSSQSQRELIIIKRILSGDSARWKILFDLRDAGYPPALISADLQRLENEGFITSSRVSGITVFTVI